MLSKENCRTRGQTVPLMGLFFSLVNMAGYLTSRHSSNQRCDDIWRSENIQSISKDRSTLIFKVVMRTLFLQHPVHVSFFLLWITSGGPTFLTLHRCRLYCWDTNIRSDLAESNSKATKPHKNKVKNMNRFSQIYTMKLPAAVQLQHWYVH